MQTNKTVFLVSDIIALLSTNNRAVERGILAIFNKQTSDEQAIGHTKHNNCVGFSGWSAKPGTYYAKWLKSGRSLDGKHLDKARKICIHHATQLTKIANNQI
jgi:hypothetical protein